VKFSRSLFVVSIITMSIACVFVIPATVSASSPKWVSIPTLAGPIEQAGAATAPCAGATASGSCIYVVGGITSPSSSQPVATTAMYDPATRVWTQIPDLPQPVSNEGVAAAPCEADTGDTCVYAIAGNGSTDGAVEMFSPKSNGWSTVAGLPPYSTLVPDYVTSGIEATAGPCLKGQGVIGTCLYGVGGYMVDDAGQFVYMYAPKSNKWSAPSALTNSSENFGLARGPCKAALSKKCLYAIGGDSGPGGITMNIVQMLHTQSGVGNWAYASPLRIPVTDLAAAGGPCLGAKAQSCIYELGGTTGTRVLNSVRMYNPKSNSWRVVPAMMSSRSYLAAAVGPCTGKEVCLYAIGGQNGSNATLNSVEALKLTP
jgi:kelch-like protein 2/3